MGDEKKTAHSIVLDAGPLIANTPPISTLLKKAEQIYTTPSVISEIKDATARARLETLVIPFVTLRTPSAISTKFVVEFARKTGDLAVLSKTDIEVIALAYELECERNGGDWRLRRTPGQKTVNGPPPARTLPEQVNDQDKQTTTDDGDAHDERVSTDSGTILDGLETHSNAIGEAFGAEKLADTTQAINSLTLDAILREPTEAHTINLSRSFDNKDTHKLEKLSDPFTGDLHQPAAGITESDQAEAITATTVTPIALANKDDLNVSEPLPSILDLSSDSDQDSDGGEWITPSNIIKHKTSSQTDATNTSAQAKTLQVATLTTDYALQNTLMLINLNLLSSSLCRIAHVRSHILRCHACFATTKQMEKQFCPRCGQPTLTRVSTSTNADGSTTLHLKKNMQWNTRGNRYSIPKPVAGSSNGKMREKGGGKGGWGKDLILAEDQKEYVRAVRDRERDRRQNERDLLDQDILPGIMGGVRSHGSGGRIQVGAGRSVNSRKKK